MKFLSFGFLLIALFFVEYNVHAVPSKPVCPPEDQINNKECLCYKALKTMICSKITNPFDLKDDYDLSSLVIKDITNLQFVGENFPKNNHKLKVKHLTILHKDGNLKLLSLYDLEEVFSISTQSIKILSSAENLATLNVDNLGAGLTSIVIEGVPEKLSLENFNLNKFKDLAHLVLRNVDFVNDLESNMNYDTKLKYVEISGNKKGFTGLLNFKPASCDEKDKIHIKLQNNKVMKYFDFSLLFAKEKCYYHIDLSDNVLDQEILNDQCKTRKIPFLKSADQLFVIMRNSPVNCNCELWNLFDKHRANLHNVQCLDRSNKYLADMTVTTIGTDISGCNPSTPKPVVPVPPLNNNGGH